VQTCNKIYYSKIYWRLNLFREAYHSLSGAPNCIFSLWNRVPTQSGKRPVTTCVYKPEAANKVWSSWCWAVCRSKHDEPSINFGIINSITWLHLVGYFYWFILQCTNPWILNPKYTYNVFFSYTENQPVPTSLYRFILCDFSVYTVRSVLMFCYQTFSPNSLCSFVLVRVFYSVPRPTILYLFPIDFILNNI
jgi:hypothetical protein